MSSKKKPRKKTAKKDVKTTHEKGLELERRTARWLRSTFELQCKKRDLARGKAVKRPYEIDVHAKKKGVLGTGIGAKDIWVECKTYKIKRTHVIKLITSAKDVRDAYNSSIEKWQPDILMLVSDTGFDIDAVGWANKAKVYCVRADPKGFTFVGRRTREKFEYGEGSF